MQYKYSKMFSDIRQDFAKYAALYPTHSNKPINSLRILFHSRGYHMIASYRILFWLNTWQKSSGSFLIKILLETLSLIAHRYWAITMKSSISGWPEIGPGLYLSNKGGIILGAKKIGVNCVIHHNVTIGKHQNKNEHPDIGNNVWIGANSLIYGEIIKDNVIVKADTIVGKSLPSGVVIEGNPGRIIRRNINKCSFESNYAPNFKNEENKNYV